MGWTISEAEPAKAQGKGGWTISDAPQDVVTAAVNKSPTAGVVDAALSLGSGAVAAPVAGVAGLLQGAKNVLSPVTMQDEGMPAGDRVRSVQEMLTYQPKTTIGKGITNAVSYPFEKLAEGADAVGGKVTDMAGPAAGAGLNTALQAVPLVLGRAGAAGGVEASAAKANALRLKNAPADAAVTSAKEAGFALPPSQANPSIWNKIVEGFAGKIKTAQDLSLKNQPIGNSLIREGLGISEDAPLTKQTLVDIRKEAGQAYERVRSTGTVSADPAYVQALDKIAAPFERASKDFPDAARTDIIDAVKAAKRESFDASSAVDQIGILRGKADTAYAAKDKTLGGAYKSIATALEDQLARHLLESGADANLINEFRGARELIAKTYTVEKHLAPSGNVDMQGLAADLKRGKYLSGEIKTAAEFGTNFRKAAQMPEKIGGVPQSPWDHYIAGGTLLGSVASGHPGLAIAAAAPYLRPLLRKAITSDRYQNTFANAPTYGPSVMSKLQEWQQQPTVPLLEMSEGQRQRTIADLLNAR